MDYNPESYDCRVALAGMLTEKLTSWGFRRIKIEGTREHVYARVCGPDLECRVYTTIDGRQTRAKDRDAIRVCMVYTGGESPRGCGKDRRVYRVGVVEGIVDRVKNRVNRITEGVETCKKCGTPTFKSRKGNQVCAALCWTENRRRSQQATRGGGLSVDARALLAALITKGNDWWMVVPDKARRVAAMDELLGHRLIEVNRKARMCRPTDRGRESYRRARGSGLAA